MGLRQTYQKMITAMAGGWEGMAGCFGMSVAALENHVYEKKGQTMSVRMARQMQDFSGTTLFVEQLCAESGGTFIKLPSVEHLDNQDMLRKFNELHAEIGNLSQSFAAATVDDEIDRREKAQLQTIAKRIHQRAEELLAVSFRIYCKDGNDTGGSEA